MWFISPATAKKSSSIQGVDLRNTKTLLAQNICIPYGEDCFDPQVGIYSKKDSLTKSVEEK